MSRMFVTNSNRFMKVRVYNTSYAHTHVAEWYRNSASSITIVSGQPQDGQHSFGVSGCHAGLMWVHCRHPLSLDAEPPRKCSNAIFSTVINSEIETQTDAAGSPALPANRRALFTYTGRSRVHTDDTCTHDTRHTEDYYMRALALRGLGRRLAALPGTLHRPPRGASCASRAPSPPYLPIERLPSRRASCSAKREESLRSCHRTAAARRTAARTSAAILGVKGAVLCARARESWPGTVSSGTGIRRSRGAGIGKDGYKAGILEEGLDRRTVEAFLTHHIDRVEEGVENPDA